MTAVALMPWESRETPPALHVFESSGGSQSLPQTTQEDSQYSHHEYLTIPLPRHHPQYGKAFWCARRPGSAPPGPPRLKEQNWKSVLADWAGELPTGHDENDRARRRRLFHELDENATGALSLAEVELGLLRCSENHVERLQRRGSARSLVGVGDKVRPALRRAFDLARGRFSSDKIQPAQFRLLLLFFRRLIELRELFDFANLSGGGHLTLNEFEQSISLFRRWGLGDALFWEEDPEDVFMRMDRHERGVITFDDFEVFFTSPHRAADVAAFPMETGRRSRQKAVRKALRQRPANFCARGLVRSLESGDARSSLRESQKFREHCSRHRCSRNDSHHRTACPCPTQDIGNKCHLALVQWAKQLPVGLDKASKASRARLFADFDANSNNWLSLGEVQQGLRRLLRDSGLSVASVMPAAKRAFHAARSFAPLSEAISWSTHNNSRSTDYVERQEFRVFLLCLQHYTNLWALFDKARTPGKSHAKITALQSVFPELHLLEADFGTAIMFDEFADLYLRIRSKSRSKEGSLAFDSLSTELVCTATSWADSRRGLPLGVAIEKAGQCCDEPTWVLREDLEPDLEAADVDDFGGSFRARGPQDVLSAREMLSAELRQLDAFEPQQLEPARDQNEVVEQPSPPSEPHHAWEAAVVLERGVRDEEVVTQHRVSRSQHYDPRSAIRASSSTRSSEPVTQRPLQPEPTSRPPPHTGPLLVRHGIHGHNQHITMAERPPPPGSEDLYRDVVRSALDTPSAKAAAKIQQRRTGSKEPQRRRTSLPPSSRDALQDAEKTAKFSGPAQGLNVLKKL